jgi:hypothetical protein
MEVKLLAGLACLLWGILGFIIGKYHERYEWNLIISQGWVPPPAKSIKIHTSFFKKWLTMWFKNDIK